MSDFLRMKRPLLRFLARLPRFLAICASVATLQAGAVDLDRAARELDALLERGWAEAGLNRNPTASDAVFVRRIHLDIAGRIPTAREAAAFLDSTDPDKRTKLIDALLAGDGYALHAFNYWADVLRLQQFGRIGSAAGAAYVLWLKESLRANKPYDVMVRELVAAKGLPWQNGAIGYYMRDSRMPLDNFANTSRIFLGTRMECAQCHDHPFDRWTQMDFYRMTAFTYGKVVKAYQSPAWLGAREISVELNREINRRFPPNGEQVAKAEGEGERRRVKFINQAVKDIGYLAMGGVGVYDEAKRVLQLPHDYQYDDAKPFGEVTPKTMLGAEATPAQGESAAETYARWLTSPDNPRFTTVIANRLWKMAFGLALIEPLDELTGRSKASNPALLARLERLVRDSGYDMKTCLAAIYRTHAYQSVSTSEEVLPGVPYFFTGPVLRRMSAEQIWDSVIALISPEPDAPSEHTRATLTAVVSRAGKVIAALDLLEPREAYLGAVAAAEFYRAAADFAIESRREIEALRVKGDDAAADALTRQVMNAQVSGRAALGRLVFLPAVERLEAIQEGREPAAWPHTESPPQPVSREQLTKKPVDPLRQVYQLKVKGFDKSPLTPAQQKTAAGDQETAFLAEAEYFGIPQAQHQAYVAARRSQLLYWRRAADRLSPEFRGHYLRIFGQSDRELIENASRDASIPQALTMMNSDLLLGVLNRGSHLQLTIRRESDPGRQLDAAYLALLSRRPTEREREMWRRAQADGLDSMDDLIYALLNTRRFVFNP